MCINTLKCAMIYNIYKICIQNYCRNRALM